MPEKTSSDLIKDLTNPDDQVRMEAARMLGEQREVLAVEALCAALHDPLNAMRWNAADAIAEIGVKTSPVIDMLIATLNDPDLYVREHVAESLDKLGDPRAVIPILQAIEKFQQPELAACIKHLPINQEAVILLVNALEVAMDLCHETEEKIEDRFGDYHRVDPRKDVIHAFRRISDPATMPALLNILRSRSFGQPFIKAAHLGIESIGSPALPYLLTALKDPDPRGRDEILKALPLPGDIKGLAVLVAEVGPAKAAILLRPTLDLELGRHKKPVTRSLKKMGWQAAQFFLELLKSSDENLRGFAVIILGHIQNRKATSYVLELYRSEKNKHIQELIIKTFGALADPASVNVLIAELEGKNCELAKDALVAIGKPAIEPLLAAKSHVNSHALGLIDNILLSIR